jgi:hypothetical protein
LEAAAFPVFFIDALEAALDFGAGFLTVAGLTTLEEDLATGPEVLRALLRGGILKRKDDLVGMSSNINQV